tara:strand:- start:1 stop:261 length:261 start_codon:yes stop_codon:yes gene_type:complete
MSEVVYFNSDGTESSVTGNDAVKQKNMEDLRAMRNQMLTDTDWTQGADSPLTDSKKTSWATYRQSLRDITDSATSLGDVTWPEKPE